MVPSKVCYACAVKPCWPKLMLPVKVFVLKSSMDVELKSSMDE